MRRMLLKIRYDGTAYCGWQVQPNGTSVQEVVGAALSNLLGVQTGVTGCSRTDSGVHANEFYCHFDTENESIADAGFVGGLNVRLPNDVAIMDCRQVSADFHARYDAKGKRYVYKMYCSAVRDPFLDKYALRISKPLDVKKVSEYCKRIVGTHDFEAFSSSGKSVSTTVRTVTDCSIAYNDGKFVFSVTGDGFLYNMVRILVGTAFYVSEGKIAPSDIPRILEAKDRSLAGPTAPPHGLYLDEVFY